MPVSGGAFENGDSFGDFSSKEKLQSKEKLKAVKANPGNTK